MVDDGIGQVCRDQAFHGSMIAGLSRSRLAWQACRPSVKTESAVEVQKKIMCRRRRETPFFLSSCFVILLFHTQKRKRERERERERERSGTTVGFVNSQLFRVLVCVFLVSYASSYFYNFLSLPQHQHNQFSILKRSFDQGCPGLRQVFLFLFKFSFFLSSSSCSSSPFFLCSSCYFFRSICVFEKTWKENLKTIKKWSAQLLAGRRCFPRPCTSSTSPQLHFTNHGHAH